MSLVHEKRPESKTSRSPAAPERSAAQAAENDGAAIPLFLRGVAGGAGASAAAGAPPAIQTKLTVNAPGDRHEQEADRVASAAKGSGSCCSGCGAGGACSRPKPSGADVPPVQAKGEAGAAPAAVSAAPAALPTSSGGEPLRPAVRSRVEPVVGADLGHVRVHTDPVARATASSLQAKAFTHRNHVFLGPRESPDDVELLAHESTHVLQQTGDPHDRVQRLEDEEAAEYPARSTTAINEAGDRADDEPTGDDRPTSVSDAMHKVPRDKVEDEKGGFEPQLAPVTAPTVTRADDSNQTAQQAGRETTREADSPPAPPAVAAGGGDGAAAGPAADAGAPAGAAAPGPAAAGAAGPAGAAAGAAAKQAASPSAAASASAAQAFAQAASIPTVEAPPEVVPPAPVMPVDAGGQALTANPPADAFAGNLAERVQYVREQGHRLRAQAALQKGNALLMRGNIQIAMGGIAQAESGIATSQQHQSARHEIHTQAGSALEVSKQKAETVAAEAPSYIDRAATTRQDSQPMAEGAADYAGQSAANTPEDAEAAGKSGEQGEKLTKVGGDTATIDGAVADTGRRGQALVEEAAKATETNTATETQLGAIDDTLTETDDRLSELGDQASGARESMEAVAGGPDQMDQQADVIDQQGQAMIDDSVELEQLLHGAQDDFAEKMAVVPAWKAPEGKGDGGPAVPVQRAPDTSHGYDDRYHVDLGSSLPSWLSGQDPQTAAQREAAEREANERRARQLALINERCGGDFSSLDAGDKMLLALELTTDNLFGDIASTNWPHFTENIIMGFVDPRIGLSGVLSGLSMVISGVGNLFSADQWAKDPLGNLLKSAADIATGITVILGSIALLAMAIAVILTAIAIAITVFSFGFGAGAAALLVPIIEFCGSVAAVVGPWAVEAAAIALELQAYIFIKNLVAAATADTADELQHDAEKMDADTKAAANMAAQIALAKVMGHGGEEPVPAGEGPPPPPAEAPLPPEAPPVVETPVTPAEAPVTPAETPVTPAETPVTPPETPVTPAETPVTPAETPVTPAETPVTPAETPVTPAETPVTPAETPVTPAETPKPGEPVSPSEATPEPAPKGATELTPAEETTLAETGAKSGAELTPEEMATERGVAERGPSETVDEPPFAREGELPNEHEWRETQDGIFCRFSIIPGCVDAGGNPVEPPTAETPAADEAPAAESPTPTGEPAATEPPATDPTAEPPAAEGPVPKRGYTGDWPPPEPGPRPGPEATPEEMANWRYQRYLRNQFLKGTPPAEVLTPEGYEPHAQAAAQPGGRPGRPGGPAQVAAKGVAAGEGWEITESEQLGERTDPSTGEAKDNMVDGRRPNAAGGTDYLEVDDINQNGLPRGGMRPKIKAELQALSPGDTLEYWDKIDPSRRITYQYGESPEVVDSRRVPGTDAAPAADPTTSE